MQKAEFSPNTTTSRWIIDANRKTIAPVFRFLFSLQAPDCRVHIIRLHLFLFSSFFLPSVTEAATFTIYSSATLNPVQLAEIGLSGSGTAYSEGNYNAEVTWDGALTNLTTGTTLEQVIAGSTVTREVLLWYYQYNSKNEPLPSFNPTYKIFSKTGIENTLSHSTYTSRTVPASITRIPVTASSVSGGNIWRAYGYATITINLETAKRSGKYQGSVQITIQYY